jgi:putative lipoic acid-binding regulatory protein
VKQCIPKCPLKLSIKELKHSIRKSSRGFYNPMVAEVYLRAENLDKLSLIYADIETESLRK